MSKTILAMMVFIVIEIIFVSIYLLKKKRKISLHIIVLGIIAGFIASNMSYNYIQPTKETVHIELVGLESDSDEVFLKQIIIDDKEIEIPEPSDGKWIWRGDAYGWFDTTNTVLQDVTKSLELEIPIGYTRQLSFETNVVNGEIVIRCGEYIENIQLDGLQGETVVDIPGNSSKEMYLFRFIQVLSFGIVFIALHLLLCYSYTRLGNVDVNIKEKYKYHVLYFGIALVSFCYLMYNADFASFWADEVFTLGFAMSNDEANSLYIATELLRQMYRIMPYGQQYLLLLPIICYTVSVYFLGLTGKRMCNGKVGVFAATCLAFSAYAYKQVAFEFRTYYMLVLFSVICFYLFVVRMQRKKDNWWMILGYGFSLLLLMDSQEYGKVLAGLFVLLDLCLMISKKLAAKNVVSDFIAFSYGVFWLINNDIGGLWNNFSWTEKPTPDGVYTTIWELCSRSNLLLMLFVLGVVMIIYDYATKYKKIKISELLQDTRLIALYFIIGIFSASIVYSVYINPENSLYLTRYFTSVIAYIFLIIGIALNQIICTTLGDGNKASTIACVWIGLWIALHGWQNYLSMPYIVNQTTRHQDFRSTAEWINLQKDVYNDSTLVYIAAEEYSTTGWNYYFTENGKKDRPNLTNNKEISNLYDYDTIYVVKFKQNVISSNEVLLQEHYELVKKVQDDDIGCPVFVYKKND